MVITHCDGSGAEARSGPAGGSGLTAGWASMRAAQKSIKIEKKYVRALVINLDFTRVLGIDLKG